VEEAGQKPARRATWLQLAVVALTAIATVAGADALLQATVAYPPPLREIEDAIDEYGASDPTIVVLGSSHARTFGALGAILAERTGGAERVLNVPVEFGKATSYLWVIENRLKPLIDEVDGAGRRARAGLRRFILVTEWWDSCPENADGRLATNVPARAWVLSDFLADAARHGLTGYNRNYMNNRFTEMAEASVLWRDRGHDRIRNGVQAWLGGVAEGLASASVERRVNDFRRIIEEGEACTQDEREWRAMREIIDFFATRGADVTVVVYPRMPATVTPKSRDGTLRVFSERIARLASEKGFRLTDWTFGTPLADQDFELDLDHMTPEGNRKLSEWALSGPLAFLAPPPGREGRDVAGGGGSDGAATGGPR